LRAWCDRLDPNDSDTGRALIEALGVFESLDVVEPSVLTQALGSPKPEVRAYAASTTGRWFQKLPATMDPGATLSDLAFDDNARVRLATIVAAGNVATPEAVVITLAASEQPHDRFIDSALHEAVVALRPQWEPLLAKADKLGWKPSWVEFLKKAGGEAAPAVFGPTTDSKTRNLMQTAATQPTGKLRATPEFVAQLSEEVRAKGDAKRGETVFRRPEVGCTACHSIGGKGGNIGPPLDAIGSGQPLDFIIGAVLEPQREVKEGYEAIEITAKDGRMIQGYRLRENAAELAVRDVAEQKEKRFSKSEIRQVKEIGSLMPSGLVDNLSREDLCDLFRFLSGLGKPGG
jgi:putative heme-binding domain-containing protein